MMDNPFTTERAGAKGLADVAPPPGMTDAARDEYRYGFHDPEEYVYRTPKGLTRDTVEEISRRKGEPAWMLETMLENGIRVRSERIPGVRSAAVGVWIRQGSAHESVAHTGLSHLLEHMVFKAANTPTNASEPIYSI